MSRVHDALRRAAQEGLQTPVAAEPVPVARTVAAAQPQPPPIQRGEEAPEGLLARVQEVIWQPGSDSLLINPTRPMDAPTEEFRTLRTRLNHMQSLQPIHTLVVTSASPAEGKSFTALNLALAEAQLAGNKTLIADFDFRRPIIHNLLGLDRSPGITDYLLGKAPLEAIIHKVANTNLYVMPAGEAVINPLELLNLREVKQLIDELPSMFNWVILDTPPLLFAADANLLSTMTHGTVLVVRIGATTIDTVTRAMQSLCQNNVVGIVVNGARRGELYSKYTYYHSYYTPREEAPAEGAAEAVAVEEVR
jgi:capsular exopolysaccharide synthesis family protein